MEGTAISWARHTHNEWIGCEKVSPGCAGCYAVYETPTRVLRAKGLEVWGQPACTPRHLTAKSNRRKPYTWDRRAARTGVPEVVFCSSLSDVLEDHPSLPPWREALWETIEACRHLRWLLLTKRPENSGFFPASWMRSWPRHVGVGVTVEDPKRGAERIPLLLRIPSPFLFLSCEPQIASLAPIFRSEFTLGNVPGERPALLARNGRFGTCADCPRDGEGRSLPEACRFTAEPDHNLRGVSWFLNGGERRVPKWEPRPFEMGWMDENIGLCRAAGVDYFGKQAGDAPLLLGRPVSLTAHHGTDMGEWPATMRVRERPSWLTTP